MLLIALLAGLIGGQFIQIKIEPQAQEWVLITVPKLVERIAGAAAPLLEGWRDRAMRAEIRKARDEQVKAAADRTYRAAAEKLGGADAKPT
ncbi:MAG: hypothetical protein RLZZ511_1832 [Cyanobacteriota bacterium]